MDEIEEYLSKLSQNLKQIKVTEKSPIIIAQKHFEYGQMLISVGRQKEAVEYLYFSWNSLKNYKYDTIYGGLVYSVGVTYVEILDYLGETVECERIFQELNTLNADGFHLGDYAYFLHRRKKDFENAERVYVKALTLYPSNSSIHLKYAGFLRHVRKNIPKAEEEYKRAIDVNPMNADAIGNYASFLHGVHRNIVDAEMNYRRAVELDDSHANNLCNYGLFLRYIRFTFLKDHFSFDGVVFSEEKNNYDDAERMYKRVLQLTPTHTNTLYNYAVLLDTHLKRKDEAEQYYRATLDIEGRHAYALYNLAVLLEEKYFNSRDQTDISMTEEEKTADKKKKVDEVTAFYRRAAECDSKDAATIADFGRFIYLHGENPLQAEPILVAALRINPKCEVALYYLALMQYKEKKAPEKAEMMLGELLKISPTHANANITLSRLVIDKIKSSGASSKTVDAKSVDKVMQMYETAINSSTKENEAVVQEYLRFVSEYGSSEQKSSAVKCMTPVVHRFQRSEGKGRRSSQDISSLTAGVNVPNNGNPTPSVSSPNVSTTTKPTRRKTLTEVISNCFELLDVIKETI